jgi:hypothetical protein
MFFKSDRLLFLPLMLNVSFCLLNAKGTEKSILPQEPKIFPIKALPVKNIPHPPSNIPLILAQNTCLHKVCSKPQSTHIETRIKDFANSQLSFVNNQLNADKKRQKQFIQTIQKQGILKGGTKEIEQMAQEILRFQQQRYDQTRQLDEKDFQRIQSDGLIKGLISNVFTDTMAFFNDRLIDFEKKNINTFEQKTMLSGLIFQTIKDFIKQRLQSMLPLYLMMYGITHHESFQLALYQAIKSYLAQKLYNFIIKEVKNHILRMQNFSLRTLKKYFYANDSHVANKLNENLEPHPLKNLTREDTHGYVDGKDGEKKPIFSDLRDLPYGTNHNGLFPYNVDESHIAIN